MEVATALKYNPKRILFQDKTSDDVEQFFWRRGPWASGINSPRQPVKKANAQVSNPDLMHQKFGAGTQQCVLTGLLGDSDAWWSVRTSEFKKCNHEAVQGCHMSNELEVALFVDPLPALRVTVKHMLAQQSEQLQSVCLPRLSLEQTKAKVFNMTTGSDCSGGAGCRGLE